jgi:adenosylcobinamide-GDP ribazoletransferase
MPTPTRRMAHLAGDLRTSLAFCTRLPLHGKGAAPGKGDVASASWAFPVAGALVGGAGGVVYWLAFRIGLPPAPAAALALAATLALTGCLHEDGLADTADGFGSGGSRERQLAIMRDSRIGTYGACALVMSLLVRWSALAALTDPVHVLLALVAAHAAARGVLPAFMRVIPAARPDGLSAAAGRPSVHSAVTATALGALALGLAFNPVAGVVGAALLGAAGAVIGRLSLRRIGGQTGDVLGALEQAGEIIVLLLGAMLARTAP